MTRERKQKQRPKTSGNGKTTLEKGGRNPPNVTLDKIIKDLSEYFRGFPGLENAKTNIEKKYDIVTKPDDCWSEDNIKQVWGKTKKLKKWSEKKKKESLSLVVALQIMKISQSCNESETKSDPDQMDLLTDNSPTVYIRIPVLKMFGSESDSSGPKPKDVKSTYKLIDGVPSSKDIRVKKYYVMSYNSETNNAEWVYEILNRYTLVQNAVTDIRFGRCIQNPGYNQGHLAAAANHMWCQEAYNSTFLFSNISPQFQILNTSIWRTLEDYCRSIIIKDKDYEIRNVHVYTGPILQENVSDSEDEGKKKRKGKNSDDDSKKKKAEPAFFFKVIIVENNNDTVEQPKCYLIPNHKKRLDDDKKVQDEAKITNKERLDWYERTVEYIQGISGLNFIEFSSINNDRIRTMTWTGEKGNGESCSAEIKVRITTPHT